jgi:hypothetical protein
MNGTRILTCAGTRRRRRRLGVCQHLQRLGVAKIGISLFASLNGAFQVHDALFVFHGLCPMQILAERIQLGPQLLEFVTDRKAFLLFRFRHFGTVFRDLLLFLLLFLLGHPVFVVAVVAITIAHLEGSPVYVPAITVVGAVERRRHSPKMTTIADIDECWGTSSASLQSCKAVHRDSITKCNKEEDGPRPYVFNLHLGMISTALTRYFLKNVNYVLKTGASEY